MSALCHVAVCEGTANAVVVCDVIGTRLVAFVLLGACVALLASGIVGTSGIVGLVGMVVWYGGSGGSGG